MAVNNVNDTYNKLISSITSSITRVIDNTGNSSSTSGGASLSDTLDLNSSVSDLPSYLNYGSTGQYSSLSLADYLENDSADEENSLFSLLEPDSTSSLFNSDDSDDSGTDSISSAFEKLADAKTKEIDDLISKTLSKYTKTDSDSSKTDSNVDK